LKLSDTPPHRLTAASGGASVIESPTYITLAPSAPWAATIASSASSFTPPPTGRTESISAWLTGCCDISCQNSRSSSRTVARSSSVRRASAASGAPAPPAPRASALAAASSGYEITGRAQMRGTHARSHCASSSGISQASRLNSVQRTSSSGKPESSQSALM